VAAALGVEVTEIRHSGKTRARQTAEIIGQALSPPQGVKAVSGLSPLDDVGPVAEELDEVSEPLMLVGHLPFLERLAGQLLALPTRVSSAWSGRMMGGRHSGS
jgi:phosphohistidine phosphatase